MELSETVIDHLAPEDLEQLVADTLAKVAAEPMHMGGLGYCDETPIVVKLGDQPMQRADIRCWACMTMLCERTDRMYSRIADAWLVGDALHDFAARVRRHLSMA